MMMVLLFLALLVLVTKTQISILSLVWTMIKIGVAFVILKFLLVLGALLAVWLLYKPATDLILS